MTQHNLTALIFLCFNSHACIAQLSSQISFKTLTGSITGCTASLEFDPSSTIQDVKNLVQQRDEIKPDDRNTPLIESVTGIHPDFQRLFHGSVELEDEKMLSDYDNIEEGTTLVFAVPHTAGNKLRKALLDIQTEMGEDTVGPAVGDERILGVVMEDLRDRYRAGFQTGENRGQDRLAKEIHGIYKPDFRVDGLKGVGLSLFNGINQDLSDYVRWTVTLKPGGKYKFKTCHAIPVHVLISKREKQSRSPMTSGGVREAAPGYVTQTGSRMAACKHWAGPLNSVITNQHGDAIGRTSS